MIRARELGCRYCIIPFENLAEGALVKDMKVVGVQNIKEVLKLVSDPDAFGKENPFSEENSEENQAEENLLDFGEICGQESAEELLRLQSADFTTSCLSALRALGRPCLPKEYLRSCPLLLLKKAWSLQKSTALPDF